MMPWRNPVVSKWNGKSYGHGMGLSTATAYPERRARSIAVSILPSRSPLVKHKDRLQSPGFEPTYERRGNTNCRIVQILQITWF